MRLKRREWGDVINFLKKYKLFKLILDFKKLHETYLNLKFTKYHSNLVYYKITIKLIRNETQFEISRNRL